jgi:HEAT repeat protein
MIFESFALRRLKNTAAKERLAAVSALTQSRSRQSAAALAEALHDDDPAVGAAATEALANRGEDPAIPHLLRLLGYRDTKISKSTLRGYNRCDCALRALNRIDSNWKARSETAAFFEQLIGGLQTDRSGYSARALASLGDSRAIGPLLKAMQSSDDGRGPAAFALATLGDATVLEPILKEYGKKNITKESIEPLARRLGTAALRPMLKHPDADVRAATLKLLEGLHDKELMPEILICLGDEVRVVGLAALDALAEAIRLGGKVDANIRSRLQNLERFIHDESKDVRLKVVHLASEIPGPATVLLPALQDPDVNVRSWALSGFYRLADVAPVAEVAKLLSGDPEAKIRRSAAEVLAKISATRAQLQAVVGALKAGLRDTDKEVRAQVEAALDAVEPEWWKYLDGEEKTVCTACYRRQGTRRSGECSLCQGKGRLPSDAGLKLESAGPYSATFTVPKGPLCSRCSGTGICKECSGRGFVPKRPKG